MDFPAEVTQHIPDPGKHLIRHYGFYSNKTRGLRTQGHAQAARAVAQNPASAPSAKQARKRWAALIKQVYEVDPLVCPKCGAEMKIVSFIERRQSEVLEKILRHCGLWEDRLARHPRSKRRWRSEAALRRFRIGVPARDSRNFARRLQAPALSA